jgi:hypothetical protein
VLLESQHNSGAHDGQQNGPLEGRPLDNLSRQTSHKVVLGKDEEGPITRQHTLELTPGLVVPAGLLLGCLLLLPRFGQLDYVQHFAHKCRSDSHQRSSHYITVGFLFIDLFVDFLCIEYFYIEFASIQSRNGMLNTFFNVIIYRNK